MLARGVRGRDHSRAAGGKHVGTGKSFVGLGPQHPVGAYARIQQTIPASLSFHPVLSSINSFFFCFFRGSPFYFRRGPVPSTTLSACLWGVNCFRGVSPACLKRSGLRCSALPCCFLFGWPFVTHLCYRCDARECFGCCSVATYAFFCVGHMFAYPHPRRSLAIHDRVRLCSASGDD